MAHDSIIGPEGVKCCTRGMESFNAILRHQVFSAVLGVGIHEWKT